jgi:hypothetical protein
MARADIATPERFIAGIGGIAGIAEAVANTDRPYHLDGWRVISAAAQIELQDEIIIVLPPQPDQDLVAVGLQQRRRKQMTCSLQPYYCLPRMRLATFEIRLGKYLITASVLS